MFQRTIEVTPGRRGLIDVTVAIAGVVAESGVRTGLCHLFLQHTSASLLVTENASPDVLRDMDAWFGRAVPDGDPQYRHDEEGPDDMSAHIRTALTAVAITVPVIDGKLGLGTWQGVYVFEHRNRPLLRRIVVTVQG